VCPWSDYTPATISFCERRLCAFIVEPSNAWSNLAYVVVGLFIVWRNPKRWRDARTAIGVGGVLIGIGSFSFHATGIRVFEIVDVSTMYVLSGLGLTFALKRWRGWGDAVALRFFVACLLVSSALMIVTCSDGILVFGLELGAAVLIEVKLRAQNPPGAGQWMMAVVGTFAVALLIWYLDLRGPLCAPDNHLVTGHAIWHTLTALTILCFFRFQRAVN
jgi:Ceramidase